MHGNTTPNEPLRQVAFARTRRRVRLSKPRVRAILARDGHVCAYCGEEAEVADHVIPWSYGGLNDEDNLVAACTVCNAFLQNRVFSNLDAKRAFVTANLESHIRKQYEGMRRRLSYCPDCGDYFLPRTAGSTGILCAACNAADLG